MSDLKCSFDSQLENEGLLLLQKTNALICSLHWSNVAIEQPVTAPSSNLGNATSLGNQLGV